MIHSSVVRWNSEGWNIEMLADSPELYVDSLIAALPGSVYSPSKLGCFGTVAYQQWIIISYIFSLDLHSLHFKLGHIISALRIRQILTVFICCNRNGSHQVDVTFLPSYKTEDYTSHWPVLKEYSWSVMLCDRDALSSLPMTILLLTHTVILRNRGQQTHYLSHDKKKQLLVLKLHWYIFGPLRDRDLTL